MALVVTFVLGLFIIVGAFIAIWTKDNERFTNFALGLAFGVMVMLMGVDLIPEVISIYSLERWYLIVIFVLLGVLILKGLDLFIPDHDDNGSNQLVHIGVISSVALVIHNIIEGMAVYAACSSSFKTGLLLSVGIGLHNIPLGMVIASIIYNSNGDKRKLFLIMFFLSLSTFVGGILMFILNNNVNEIMLGVLLCITLGMIIYISLLEILPKVIKSKDKKTTFMGVVLGIILLMITVFI